MEFSSIDVERQSNALEKNMNSSALLQGQSPAGKPLVYYLLNSPSTNVFVRLMGLVAHQKESTAVVNVLQCLWSLFIFVSVLLMIAFALWDMYESFYNYGPSKARVVYFLYGITVFLQAATLLMSLRELRQRLNSTPQENEVMHFSSALRVSYIVLVMTLLIGLVTPLAYFYSGYFFLLEWVLFVGEVATCCVLTATMYFIATDCNVALALLSQLVEQSRLQLLTMEQFTSVRAEIKERESRSAWIYNAIVIVALLDILCVISAMILNLYGDDTLYYLIVFPLFLKEIPFIVVVYWVVAQVNERSAEFTSELACTAWDRPGADNQLRRDIYISAAGRPISFSIAGMTLKRRDMMIQFAVWGFAFFLSICRSVLAARV